MADPLATAPADDPPARAAGWAAFLGRLTWRSVAVALSLGAAAAALLYPAFHATPFAVVLGRCLFLSMVLLLAFAAAGHWQQRWLPRWLMQALAVVLAAPVATAAVYLLSTGGSASAFLANRGMLWGFAFIAGTGVVVGLVLALGAMVREQQAHSRAQQLHFELERNRLERQALDARLSLLRSQIEPHFLFNTLANVQALVEGGSPRAAPVLGSLIAYLRAAMPRLHDDDNATLGRECALVRAYLELMHMRMPDRLSFGVEVPDSLSSCRFPPMALLTLVENAVRHGIDPSEQGGHIEVGAARDEASRATSVWVRDSGQGMATQAAEGTGLTNLRERLQVFFDGMARLEIEAADGGDALAPRGLCARIVIVDRP